MIIALDMDGPIVNLHEHWLKLYNKDYNDNLTYEQINDWDIRKFVKCPDKIFNYLTEPNFFYEAEPVDGAIEAVKELNKRHQVYIVTACPPGTGLEDKCRWIAKYLPFLQREQIIITYHKFMVNANVLYDDAPEHLQTSPSITVAWDTPYNQHVYSCFRTKGSDTEKWQRFLEIIKEIERGVYVAGLH